MNSEWLSASAFANVALVDAMYNKYLSNPKEVTESWRHLFQQFDSSHATTYDESAHAELRIANLINSYRTYGHLYAHINPLEESPPELPSELQLTTLGFDQRDLHLPFPTLNLLPVKQAPLTTIIKTLETIYCGKIGFEYMGINAPDVEAWLQEQLEQQQHAITIKEKERILEQLNRCELFEKFLHTKYVGQKRFSLEGGETLIPILGAIVEEGADLGIKDFVIGMAHRGRLNVLSNILNKSYETIFSEFEERYLPNTFEGSGDVKYHKGFSSTLTTADGKRVDVTLCPNPSHLEAVNPVVEGMAHALQHQTSNGTETIIPILIHGDAAIAGQGIIYETLQLYDLPGYSTGGTLHIVINNQIGFTTHPEQGRSTHYCTDIARAFRAPVFHVNGEEPESCIYATLLALAIRQRFHCDVFIDLYCYRKYGHNESDEPAYTQPLEYSAIRKKQPIRELYRDALIKQGVVERHVAEALEEKYKQHLQKELDGIKERELAPPSYSSTTFEWSSVDTAVDGATLATLSSEMCRLPDGFNAHKKIAALLEDRRKMILGDDRKPIDWGMGELLAYATLLNKGTPIRLAGQDCGRGTFSHRHALITDQQSGEVDCPLKRLGRCDIFNSPLSEYAALGFEYGYTLGCPEGLTIWEAQFGDFANGGQVIIDQFIVNGEQKWNQTSKLVLLLPHGYEGQGPEHSSARIERFLSLCGDDNLFAIYPTNASTNVPPTPPTSTRSLEKTAGCFHSQRVAAPSPLHQQLRGADERLLPRGDRRPSRRPLGCRNPRLLFRTLLLRPDR